MPRRVVVLAFAAILLGSTRVTPAGAARQALEGHVEAARLLGPGVVSTEDDEIGGSLSPDGEELYFTRLAPYTTFPRLGVICVARFVSGRWIPPRVAPFSGRYLDLPPRFAPDGRRLYFASSRPLPGSAARGLRVWSVERVASGWGEAVPLGAPVNDPEGSWNLDPSVAADGTIYFASDRERRGRFHIYRCRLDGGVAQAAEKLGPEINSAFDETQPFVSADGKTLFFASTGLQEPPYASRPEDLNGAGAPYPRADLYVSRSRDGVWTRARHLGHGINSVADEGYPSLTGDGRYLIFSSARSRFGLPLPHALSYADLERDLHSLLNGGGNLYYVSTDVLDLPR